MAQKGAGMGRGLGRNSRVPTLHLEADPQSPAPQIPHITAHSTQKFVTWILAKLRRNPKVRGSFWTPEALRVGGSSILEL